MMLYGLTTLNKPKSREVSTNDEISTKNSLYAAALTSRERLSCLVLIYAVRQHVSQ